MNKIQTDTLYHDIIERLTMALDRGNISADDVRKLKSRARIFYAINEAVKAFVTKADVPLNALSGFRPSKLYTLQKTSISDYDGLAVYEWPPVANQTRQDAGLLRLNLDGKTFEPTMTLDQDFITRRIESLQNQAGNTLMYGPKHKNAVVDLPGLQIYVPADVVPKAQLIVAPDTIATETLAFGKKVITVTSAATADGNITITNTTDSESVTVAVVDGDSPEQVAAKVVAEINKTQNIASLQVTAVLYANEFWLYTTGQGTSATKNITIDVAGTGVTVDDTDFDLLPAETADIPIDVTHQEDIAVLAFNQLVTNIAFSGQRTAVSDGDEE